jgi:hypothetical protein
MMMPISDNSGDYQSGNEQSNKPLLPAEAEATLRSDAEALATTVKEEVDKVAAEAGDQVGALAEQAKAQIAEVTDKAKGLATEQKELLAGQIGGVADAMEKVATELERSNASSAHYARMIADGASQLSSTVRDNDVDQILGMAQDFGRRQPVAFMGAAALLGFAASRFVLASAKREDKRPASPANGATQTAYNDSPTSVASGDGSSAFDDGRL